MPNYSIGHVRTSVGAVTWQAATNQFTQVAVVTDAQVYAVQQQVTIYQGSSPVVIQTTVYTSTPATFPQS